jgi:hypothetical protein
MSAPATGTRLRDLAEFSSTKFEICDPVVSTQHPAVHLGRWGLNLSWCCGVHASRAECSTPARLLPFKAALRSRQLHPSRCGAHGIFYLCFAATMLRRYPPCHHLP